MTSPLRHIPAGSGNVSTDLWIGPGLLDAAASRLVSPSGRFLLVTSAGPRAAAQRIRRALAGRLLIDLEIDDREESKTLGTVSAIADAALAAGVRRDDALVAVGGGVVSDVAGFAAAILLRGIPWNAVPTTTGSMADAAIGGKTGVDHREGKNLLGAFHPPRVVLADPAALDGLPEREFRAGLVEALKAAWIADAPLARRAEESLTSILAREEAALLDLLAGAAAVKAEIVAGDLRESDRRRLLNFGHTLGHAFEASGGYQRLRHGEAVAWGIRAALDLSVRRSGLPEEAAGRVANLLSRLGPFPAPETAAGRLEPFLSRDKKATARGIAGVLLQEIGTARVEEAIPLQEWLDAAARISLP
ncbi:MAG: 3-dehydroquinate synthase [Acidobacteriota bacterium]|nr:3-dehydroquinate synthase [Acidobacteriota bacterium]